MKCQPPSFRVRSLVFSASWQGALPFGWIDHRTLNHRRWQINLPLTFCVLGTIGWDDSIRSFRSRNVLGSNG